MNPIETEELIRQHWPDLPPGWVNVQDREMIDRYCGECSATVHARRRVVRVDDNVTVYIAYGARCGHIIEVW